MKGVIRHSPIVDQPFKKGFSKKLRATAPTIADDRIKNEEQHKGTNTSRHASPTHL